MSSHDHPQEAAPSCHPMIRGGGALILFHDYPEEVSPQGLHYILAGTAQSVERQVRILPLPAVLEITLGSHSSGSLSI